MWKKSVDEREEGVESLVLLSPDSGGAHDHRLRIGAQTEVPGQPTKEAVHERLVHIDSEDGLDEQSLPDDPRSKVPHVASSSCSRT